MSVEEENVQDENVEDNYNEFIDLDPTKDEGAIEVSKINKLGEIKEQKKKAIEELVVSQHGVPYAGDDKSQARMTSTGAIANWMFNKALGDTLLSKSEEYSNTVETLQGQLEEAPENQKEAIRKGISEASQASAIFGAVGAIADGVYKAVYIDQKIGWKGADKQVHLVQGESVLEALLKSMQEVGKVITTSVEEVEGL
jgi:hypothetical protein